MARGNSAPRLISQGPSLTFDLQTKKTKKGKKAAAASGSGTGADATSAAGNTTVTKRHQAPQVEEADDD
jgi:hypothetical protein